MRDQIRNSVVRSPESTIVLNQPVKSDFDSVISSADRNDSLPDKSEEMQQLLTMLQVLNGELEDNKNVFKFGFENKNDLEVVGTVTLQPVSISQSNVKTDLNSQDVDYSAPNSDSAVFQMPTGVDNSDEGIEETKSSINISKNDVSRYQSNDFEGNKVSGGSDGRKVERKEFAAEGAENQRNSEVWKSTYVSDLRLKLTRVAGNIKLTCMRDDKTGKVKRWLSKTSLC